TESILVQTPASAIDMVSSVGPQLPIKLCNGRTLVSYDKDCQENPFVLFYFLRCYCKQFDSEQICAARLYPTARYLSRVTRLRSLDAPATRRQTLRPVLQREAMD